MNIKKKKQVLKNIILNDEFSYDMTVYRLINTNCLDKIISEINDMDVVCNINPNNKMSAEEQFLQLLNRFIVRFKNIFPNVNNFSEHIIENIFNSNQSIIGKYLLSKHYLGDNEYTEFFYNNIYKLFIINLISNIKYISDIEDLLKEENIEVKNIDDYTKEEIHSIKNLMSCLVFCSRDGYSTLYLFYNVDYEVEKYLKSNDLDCDNKSHKKKIIEIFKTQYQFIISDYKKRKKYLKYFKY